MKCATCKKPLRLFSWSDLGLTLFWVYRPCRRLKLIIQAVSMRCCREPQEADGTPRILGPSWGCHPGRVLLAPDNDIEPNCGCIELPEGGGGRVLKFALKAPVPPAHGASAVLGSPRNLAHSRECNGIPHRCLLSGRAVRLAMAST